ncbi:thiamine pyrophosphate-binding protein [Hydrogenophaga sp.]|uniref:thiamine pyrophosphate-binding protein n=1 Tax=Hydrogenophaga sp. TaxID=1904254 RepID=UPI002721056A|nr:thiamine pyrophosphate-binding protein [Hydrogenophaga sp.]MDO9435977.1 thiamine pyrophosphate-binding protein [Hydrogenophaga sp.]
MKVYEALADALAQESAGPIFGLMGDANMALWHALGRNPKVRMVWSRHEGGAIAMADGYGQASGELAVATVTSGPGLANAANSILTAARASTPMVIYTGEYPGDGKAGYTQALDQARFGGACEAQVRELGKVETLAQDIAEAFYIARTQRCVVILNMPLALWEAEFPWEWEYEASKNFLPPALPDVSNAVLAELADMVCAAERPVLLAGRGAVQAGARADIEAVGERIGALYATSLLAKGFFDGNPHDVGVSGSFSSQPTEVLLAQADLVVAFGASLNFFTTEGGMLFAGAQVARVDRLPHPVRVGATPGLYVQGDAKHTARALAALLAERRHEGKGFRVEATKRLLEAPAVQATPPQNGLDPRRLMRHLSAALPAGAQVVSGAGHFWSWPIAYLALPSEGRYQHTAAFGSIGLGLGSGVGAAVGQPDRLTVVIEGDGGLLQSISELHAAAVQGIPLVLLVMNDSGYGAEVHKLNMKDRDAHHAQWTSPDFVALAKGFGADGVRLERDSDVGDAVRQAIASKKPFLIDARISPTLVSDSYRKMFLGEANVTPLLRQPS